MPFVRHFLINPFRLLSTVYYTDVQNELTEPRNKIGDIQVTRGANSVHINSPI